MAAVTQGQGFSFAGQAGVSFAVIVAGELVWGLVVGWGGLVLPPLGGETRVEIIFALLSDAARRFLGAA